MGLIYNLENDLKKSLKHLGPAHQVDRGFMNRQKKRADFASQPKKADVFDAFG